MSDYSGDYGHREIPDRPGMHGDEHLSRERPRVDPDYDEPYDDWVPWVRLAPVEDDGGEKWDEN
jgi:hypothetical protein